MPNYLLGFLKSLLPDVLTVCRFSEKVLPLFATN